MSYAHSPGLKRLQGGKHPVQVARRNERERKRVQQVNNGFVTLRNHVPVALKNKKLSKVETLRQAAAYIEYLQAILAGGNPPHQPRPACLDPQNMESESFYPNYASPDFLLNNCSPADLSTFPSSKPSPASDASSFHSPLPDSTTSPHYPYHQQHYSL